jgi:hypothetical protein
MNTCNLLLIRDTFGEKSTYGKLYVNGEFMAHTLELAWRDNQRSVSCIPKGVYDCRLRLARESASRDYLHLLVKDVPGRTWILFHVGNYASSDWKEGDRSDSRGCILTGERRASEPNKINNSRNAHTYLMETITGREISDKIELVIKNR